MTQAQLDRAVAQRTGESLSTIRRRGFSVVAMPELCDFDDLAPPQVVDWDASTRHDLDCCPATVVKDVPSGRTPPDSRCAANERLGSNRQAETASYQDASPWPRQLRPRRGLLFSSSDYD